MSYLERLVDAQLEQLLATVPVVTIEGARATGKTTTALQWAESEIRLPRDLDLLRSDPYAVLARLAPPVLLDEWQLAGTDVLWAIKDIVDDSPRPGSFILTGSVQPESYGPTYPLTGRGARVVMYPMNRRELEGIGGAGLWIDAVLSGGLMQPNPESHAKLGLGTATRSGFPSTRDVDAPTWLRAYAASVAERSVDERRDPVRVGRMLRVLAELEAMAVPDERIIQAADINRVTFQAYDTMLQRAHVSVPAAAWQTNRLKRLTSFAKRFTVDAALSLAIAGVREDELLADPALAGHYLESFVAAQLRPEVEVRGGGLYHLRTRAGEHEVDLVVEVEGRLIAIEVKHAVQPRPEDAKHLAWFVDSLGNRVAAAVVLHRGTATYELAPRVWAVPITSMWS